MLAKLKAELVETMPDADVLAPLSKLESLPYLRASDEVTSGSMRRTDELTAGNNHYRRTDELVESGGVGRSSVEARGHFVDVKMEPD